MQPHLPRHLATVAALAALLCGTSACMHASGIHPRGASVPIDLERFMGAWYVIAHIPTSTEEDAYEAVERYTLRDDGTIDVRFHFCEGGFDGPPREVTMDGWVYDPATNAEWRVRPFWPLALQYQIVELTPDYDVTVVVHPSGGYAWVMARNARLPDETLGAITRRLEGRGYETERLRRVPQRDGACRAPFEPVDAAPG